MIVRKFTSLAFAVVAVIAADSMDVESQLLICDRFYEVRFDVDSDLWPVLQRKIQLNTKI